MQRGTQMGIAFLSRHERIDTSEQKVSKYVSYMTGFRGLKIQPELIVGMF